MNRLVLAWRLLKRDWHGGELGILLSALIIAVSSVTAINLFTQRINLAMQDQSGRFLGGDLLLSSSRPIEASISDYAQQQQLQLSQGIRFSSVIVANDNFQLAQVKAIDSHYPLRSHIKIARNQLAQEIETQQGPQPGEVWLSPRLIHRLGVRVGDPIELGEARFKVAAILKHDPGQAGSFISIAPRLLMHLDDIEKTQVIQPGSRIIYQQLFAGPLKQRQSFANWLKPRLKPTDRLVGGKQGSLPLKSAMQRAEQYLALASMLSVMLAGIAIAVAANRYSKRHYDQSALMRCMGASQQQLLQVYSSQLLMIALLATALGCLAGYVAQQGLVFLLADFLPANLPSANYQPYLSGLATGIVTLMGFSLPAILRLKSVSPLRVLRRELSPLPLSALSMYGLALGSLLSLMWWQSGNLLLTGIVMTGILLSLLILGALSRILLSISRQLIKRLNGPWRAGLQQLLRYRQSNQLQILAFGMALMIMLTILLLRTDLLNRWQAQLPEQAPNHFVINIQAADADNISAFFKQHGITSQGLFPMVRGRMTQLNQAPIQQAVSAQASNDESLRRELNLSWMRELPADNQLLQGRWFNEDDIGQPVISVEIGMATRLGLKLGDQLSFQLADRSISARIISLRSVRWDSFQPNFYIIFPPQVMESFPANFITSFYLAEDNKLFINQLIQQYPELTIIEIDAVMKQVRSILNQVTLAVEYIMLFVLLAGITVLLATLQASMDERLHTSTILRTLGAKKSYLRNSQLAEFSLLGLFSGLLAVSGTELIAFALYTWVFKLSFELHAWLWLVGILAGVVLITLSAMGFTRKIVSQAPMKTLQEV